MAFALSGSIQTKRADSCGKLSKMSIQAMQENEKVTDVWKRIKEKCEVSDVLVLNQNGEISCYYLDEEYPQYIAGFIRLNTSGALVTIDTENYQIDGKKGNWIATDSIILDGKQFYLMEHQEYRNQAAAVVLDAYGKMIVEECRNGFDEETKQKIQSYIQQMNMPDPVRQVRHQQKVRLEYIRNSMKMEPLKEVASLALKQIMIW